ncbi:hypothetical protein [Rhodobacter sp. NSM]|uniref:hypothetical protein n=1 Tax=Rhodobacter sp. NSM TaxID=3457501 RepID=UPI003FD5D3BB
MTEEQINALTMPELVALSQALVIAVAAGEKAAKLGQPFVTSLIGDADAVAITLSVDVVQPEASA